MLQASSEDSHWYTEMVDVKVIWNKVENFYQFLSRARAWHGTRIPYSYPLSSSTKAAASVRSRISAVRFGSSWLLNIILISPLQQHAQMGDQHVDRLSLQNLAPFPIGKWHDCAIQLTSRPYPSNVAF